MSRQASENRCRRTQIASAILVGFGLAVFGCSGGISLTEPEENERAPAGATSFAGDEASGDDSEILAQQPTTVSPSKTEIISAEAGGRISLGVYSLTFPPGSLDSDTEIRVVDVGKDRGYPCVELFPEGIKFDKPVTLDMRIPAGVDTRGYTMWWWGPGSDGAFRWINVGGKVSADGTTLSVTLEHFSTYAPGKAGWWKPQNPVGLPRPEQGGHR